MPAAEAKKVDLRQRSASTRNVPEGSTEQLEVANAPSGSQLFRQTVWEGEPLLNDSRQQATRGS